MDSWYSDTVAAGVTMYLLVFALVTLGVIAYYIKYRVFGVVVLCGAAALLAALLTGWFL
jgi:hypothetical protein